MASIRGRSGRRGRGKGRGFGCRRGGGHYPPSPPHYSAPPLVDNDDVTDTQSPEASADDMMIDDVGSSSRKKELIPGELWFTKPDVVRGVTNSIKNNYNHPWRNWTETPKETKDLWFREFKHFFTWRPELEWEVRSSYDERARKRLKDMAHKATQKKPSWMSTGVHIELLKRKEEEDFKKRSEQAKRNKRGGLDGNVHPGHCQGSISTVEVADRLAKAKGVFPTAADVYIKTHSREEEGRGNVLVGEKPKKIMEDYNRKIAEYKAKGINKDPNEVYWEVVGGRKKGHVRGLGMSDTMFYERSTGRACNSSYSHMPSLRSSEVEDKRSAEENCRASQQQRELHDKQIAELERQRVELERQRAELERERLQLERERVQAEREKLNEKKQFNEYMWEMQKTQKQMNEFFLLFASKTLQCEPQPQPLTLHQPSKSSEAREREKSTRLTSTPGPSQTWKNKKRRRE